MRASVAQWIELYCDAGRGCGFESHQRFAHLVTPEFVARGFFVFVKELLGFGDASFDHRENELLFDIPVVGDADCFLIES